MRKAIIVLCMLMGALSSSFAQVSISIGLPNVSIGVHVPVYPQLVQVPGYPVYYAPHLNWNYFFYDGMFWVYHGDHWYASAWYNGPWGLVPPLAVPLFVLRIPVGFYRDPPPYFHRWHRDAPPRWGEHWGRDWDAHRRGWDQWDRRFTHPPAPPPVYQRQYSGDRYPRIHEWQQDLHQRNYRYQPRDTVVRQHYREQNIQPPPSRPGRPPPEPGRGRGQDGERGDGRDRHK
jgi:hypothetical protein